MNYLKVARNVAFVLMIAGWSMVGSTAPVSASTDLCVESGTCQYAVVHEFCNSTCWISDGGDPGEAFVDEVCGMYCGQMCEGNSGDASPSECGWTCQCEGPIDNGRPGLSW